MDLFFKQTKTLGVHMAIKHGDPAQIRQFAALLQSYCNQSKQGLSKLKAQLNTMGQTSWKDQNQRIYTQEFEQVVMQLHKAMQAFEIEQSKKLRALAQQYDQVKY